MHVGLGHVRQIVIDDVTDPFDINTARGDVGRDEHPDLTRAEGRQHAFALTLRFVAMERVRGDAGVAKIARDLIGPVLGSGED